MTLTMIYTMTIRKVLHLLPTTFALQRIALVCVAAAMIAVAPRATFAIDWIVAPSYFTHDPESGQRVTQYTPIGPVYSAYDPTYVKSGFRHSRSSLQVGGFSDHMFVVEEYGRPVRPFGEWQRPFRPYSVPYPLWGPPYAFYGYGDYPQGGYGRGGYGPGGYGPGYPGTGPYGPGGYGGGPYDFDGGYGGGYQGHGGSSPHPGGDHGDKDGHVHGDGGHQSKVY